MMRRRLWVVEIKEESGWAPTSVVADERKNAHRAKDGLEAQSKRKYRVVKYKPSVL